MEDKVEAMGDKVQYVDEKVQAVIDGSHRFLPTLYTFRYARDESGDEMFQKMESSKSVSAAFSSTFTTAVLTARCVKAAEKSMKCY